MIHEGRSSSYTRTHNSGVFFRSIVSVTSSSAASNATCPGANATRTSFCSSITSAGGSIAPQRSKLPPANNRALACSRRRALSSIHLANTAGVSAADR